MKSKGLITMGGGIIAVLASFLSSWGPCGPASIPAFILFYGGILTFLVGCGILGNRLLCRLLDR